MPVLRTLAVGILALVLLGGQQAQRAKNVILFIGDAGGIPTLHAASVYGHRHPQALFIQQMPHIALMDTSAVDTWVTDSAAGMSAIVTGQKTDNGVISQSADAVSGQRDGAALRTILEHAEARGLSSGLITNMSIADATPAACYAHANDRGEAGKIFAQLATPRYGDGPDVVVGAGRTAVLGATKALGIDIQSALSKRGYALLESPASLGAGVKRAVALTDNAEFDPVPVLDHAISILSRNRRGYFLMVEWDMHTDQVERGLKRSLTMDALVREAASKASRDTLIVFTADHSFDLRVRRGRKDQPLLEGFDQAAVDEAAAAARAARSAARPATVQEVPPVARPVSVGSANVRVENGHTGEQVLVAAQGPGAERVRGFIQNTDLFRIMMAAWGWKEE
jgi:alkaline phosphatase